MRNGFAAPGLGIARVPKLRRRNVLVLAIATALLPVGNRWADAQAASATGALPQLSYSGVELAPVQVDPAHVAIQVTVDLAGDLPLASYLTARPRGMPALQRTASGAWVTWNQQPESLIDNRIAPSNGHLVFAVSGADFTAQSFPIAISVAYRTATGVKYGLFTITPKP
jgi:hypothetical protein